MVCVGGHGKSRRARLEWDLPIVSGKGNRQMCVSGIWNWGSCGISGIRGE